MNISFDATSGPGRTTVLTEETAAISVKTREGSHIDIKELDNGEIVVLYDGECYLSV